MPEGTNNFSTVKNKESKVSITANAHRSLLLMFACAQITWAAGVWTILDRFGYRGIVNELMGEKTHKLDNVMTLAADLHTLFDRLELWLEKVPHKVC